MNDFSNYSRALTKFVCLQIVLHNIRVNIFILLPELYNELATLSFNNIIIYI